ncbi:MAG: hypothetical protein OHK0039_07550 [Bacteroidia bacterium]
MSQDEGTQQRILAAARSVFYAKGLDGARMDEIAREAGINKAMLHYYFRSKQDLFDKVLIDTFSKIIPQVLQIISQPLPLIERMQQFSQFYNDLLRQEPQIPVFLLNAIQAQHTDSIDRLLSSAPLGPRVFVGQFLQTVAQEMDAGRIPRQDPRDVLINMVALSVFPFMLKPLMVRLLGIGEEDFDQYIRQRRDSVPDFLARALRADDDSSTTPST